jgi:hypothetical protein
MAMNDRMMVLLDRLAQREREEAPGYMEILPPLHAEIGQPGDFEQPGFPLRWVQSFAGSEELQEASAIQ